MRESVPYKAVYGHKGAKKGRNFRNHALCGPGKTGSASKHAIVGTCGWAKGGVLKTTPHMNGGGQAVPVFVASLRSTSVSAEAML